MKSSEPPPTVTDSRKLYEYPLFSIYIQWLMSLPEFDSLSPLEFFVLVKFVRRTIKQHGEPLQDRVTEILDWLDVSVNTFNKAMDGLIAKGLMRKERGELLYEPLKYVVALPPQIEPLPSEVLVQEQAPPCLASPSMQIEVTLKETVRALLFLSGTQHLSAVRLSEMTGSLVEDIEMVVAELRAEMEGTSLRLDNTAAGYIMGTRAEFKQYTTKILTKKQQHVKRLPESEKSVIASIMVHGGPASRAEIAAIRKSTPSESLSSLIRKGLVGISHAKHEYALPRYYVTSKCLDILGVRSFEDLITQARAHCEKPNAEGIPQSSLSENTAHSPMPFSI